MTSLGRLRTRAKWWCFYSSLVCLFLLVLLSISAHQVNWYLTPTQIALAWLLLILALLTALLSVLVIPRWQAIVALAITVFTIWWLFTSGPKPDPDSASLDQHVYQPNHARV